jgi:serine/threonine-protein phosphatase 2A regulatory subunit B
MYSDGETFVSADDVRISLWHLEVSSQCFNIVDTKPADMEDLVGDFVIFSYYAQVLY